jgi:hypothetical protein
MIVPAQRVEARARKRRRPRMEHRGMSRRAGNRLARRPVRNTQLWSMA